MSVAKKITHRKGQQGFSGEGLVKPNDCFGGSLLKNSNAKVKRPLDSKFPIHLVLRAQRSCLRKPKAFAVVNEIVRETAKKYGVKLYRYANVGNHLHLLLRLARRERWNAFIRELTGQIAQTVGEKKGFWLYRPFTRVVRGWQKAYKIAKEYIYLNELEAEKCISRLQITTLKDLRAVWAVS